ncbi:MAG: hypothetical protein IKN38_04755, partial [Clostridia bacterium]|nr:hypothetical protein [Clostridia bacterium]
MRAKEFGLWKSRAKNANSGMRESGDPFNRALKGQPYQRPSEYNNTDYDEYHHYPEFRDLEYEEEEKKQQSDQKKDQSKNSSSGSGRATSRVAQNIVGRVVALSVGAVMVASGYQAMGGELPFELPFSFFQSDTQEGPASDPSSVSTNWTWSEDHQSATLELSDGSGIVIKTIEAV